MNSSPLPWTTAPSSSGGAFLKDASGKTIALFSDYRDAELVAQNPAEGHLIGRLRDRIYDLEQALKEKQAK